MSNATRSPCKYILKGTGPMVDHRVEVRGDGHLLQTYDDDDRPDRKQRLSPLRWRLLDVLVGYPGRSFKSEELAERLQEAYPDLGLAAANAVAVHISHMRHALGDEARDSGFIKTLDGAYQLCAEVDVKSFLWPPGAQDPDRDRPQDNLRSGDGSENEAEDEGKSEILGSEESESGPGATRLVRAEQGEPEEQPARLTPDRTESFWTVKRRLLALILLFALSVPTLIFIVRQPFKVGTGRIEHQEDPVLRESAEKLPERLREAIGEVPPWRLYDFSNSPLDRPARLEGVLSRRENTLYFLGRLNGLASGCKPELRQEAPESFSGDLVDKLAADVGLHLDWEACVHPLRLAPFDSQEVNVERRAKHCLRAAGALRKDLRFCEAKEVLLLAVEKDPGLYDAQDLLASVYENLGADEDALKVLLRFQEQVDEQAPLETKLRLDRRIAQLEGRFDRALAILQRLTETEEKKNANRQAGESPDRNNSTARSWFYRAHKQDCQEALDLLPDDHDNSALKGDFELACGRPAKAIESYKKRYDNETDSGALYPLAHGYRLGGAAKKARTLLETLLERSPSYHLARLELAGLLTEQGCRVDAEKQIDALLEQLTSEPAGGALCLLEKPSIANCRPLALERDVRIAAALSIEIDALGYKEALEHARKAQYARELSPNKAHRWSIRAEWAEGLVHLAHGQLQPLPEIEATMAKIKNSREAGGSLYEGHYLHHLRGRRLLAEGRAAEAIQEFQTIFDDYAVEEHAYYRTDLARAHEAAGQREQAKKHLNEALQFDPKYRSARCALAGLELGPEAKQLCESEPNPVCTEES